MSIAVIYQSKYGAAKQYAAWIAEALNADLLERHTVTPDKLLSYDTVIYGGGLYAGAISGVDLVAKNPCKNLVVFTVGLGNPETADYSDVMGRNFPAGMRDSIKVFPLRGGIDYKRLSFVHRIMMAAMKKFVMDKKPVAERTADDRAILESYGDKIDFTDKKAVSPIIDYVRSLSSGTQ